MATIKFSRLASRVRVQLQDPAVDSMKDVRDLKEEVRFLKNVLQLKSSGGGMSEIIYKLKYLEKENRELREQRTSKVEMHQVLKENHRLKTQMELLRVGDSLRDLKRPDSRPDDSQQSIVHADTPENTPDRRDLGVPASAGLLPSIHKPKPNKTLSSENSQDAKEPTEEASEYLDSFPQIRADPRQARLAEDLPRSRIFVDDRGRDLDFLGKMRQDLGSSPSKKINRSHLHLETQGPDSPFPNKSSLSTRHNPHPYHSQQPQMQASSQKRAAARSQLDSLQMAGSPHRAASKYSSSKRHQELVTMASINTDKLEKLQYIHRLFESLEKRPGLGSLASFKPVFKQRNPRSKFDPQLTSVKLEMARLNFN